MEGPGAGGRVRLYLLTTGDGGPLHKDIGQRGDEGRVRARGRRPDVGQMEALGGLAGLGVQVEDDLHVVRHEANRRDDDARGHRHRCPVGQAPGCQGLQVVVDIRLQPAGLGRARARAVDQVRLRVLCHS